MIAPKTGEQALKRRRWPRMDHWAAGRIRGA
jgi:hypothetical protein